MHQVTDKYWTGKVELEEVAAPTIRARTVLVPTAFSLISAGTERMKVLEAVTRDGVAATYEKLMNHLKTPVPLGYSLAGTVADVGEGVAEFRIGNRVACAGSSANHAEFNLVPKNLCCRP